MDAVTLLLVFAGLLILLIVLVTIYVWLGRSKKQNSGDIPETFEGMVSVINRTSSSNKELNHAVDMIVQRYSKITDFETYASALEKLCTHPNTDSKLILRFQKALIAVNPKEKEKIENRLKLGLAGRK